MMKKFLDVPNLVTNIECASRIALAPDYSGCSLVSVVEIVKQKISELHLIGVPSLGVQGDILIGGNCVTSVEAAAVSIGEFGPGPRFSYAYRNGHLKLYESTCPAIHSGLQASEKGIPYMPMRGAIGSDIMDTRDTWLVQDNPFAEIPDRIVLVKAIKPDIALFHCPLADIYGNVWIGVRRELVTMAHASKKTLVTCEKIYKGNLLEDDQLAAGTISALYISEISHAPLGAWPVGLFGCYSTDIKEVNKYLEIAKSEGGFSSYVENFRAS